MYKRQLLDLHVAQTAALIVGLELIEVLVLRQELGEVLRAAESVDVYKRQTLNGSLAGLVAITAGCDAVSPFGAFLIGFVAGILVVLSVEFFDKIAKIDDPVGAVSVHFANGVWEMCIRDRS